MYMLRDGELEWQESEAENIHVEVIVCDGADHRFFPCLSVRATLIDGNGKESARMSSRPSGALPLALQAQLENPGNGDYRLRVHIDAPQFPRHDKVNGKRFAEPVEVKFTGVEMKTGKE